MKIKQGIINKQSILSLFVYKYHVHNKKCKVEFDILKYQNLYLEKKVIFS